MSPAQGKIENVTVLFVVYSTKLAKEFCTRGIVLDHGKTMFEGTIEDAIELYENS